LRSTKKLELKELIARKKPLIIAVTEVKPKITSQRTIQDFKI